MFGVTRVIVSNMWRCHVLRYLLSVIMLIST